MEQEVEAFQEFLRKRALKLTTQRNIIAKRIFRTTGHFSAEDIVDAFRREKKPISKSTVYRTLELLVEADLLDTIDFDQGYKLYERCLGRSHHDHLICVECRRVIEFCNEEIERQQDRVSDQHGFRILWHTHKIYGLCEPCAKRVDGSARAIPGGARQAH